MYSWKAEFGRRFAGRTVLVTGATGFIGRHLSRALHELGAEVHGLWRAATPPEDGPPIRYRQCDLEDAADVESVVGSVRPEIVYHLAGFVTGSQELSLVKPMLETNLLGTVNLLLALQSAGCRRLVHVGSSEEPGTAEGIPTSPYAASKVAATHYVRMFHLLFGVPATVARVFLSYGPGQAEEKLIPYLIRVLDQGETPRIASPERVCDFVYVMDVVRGLLAMGLEPGIEGRIVDLGTGRGTSVGALPALLSALMGRDDARIDLGAGSERVGERTQLADIGATRRALDWEPRWSLEAGLLETAKAYKVGASDE